MKHAWHVRLGGRKFLLSVYGISAVVALGLGKSDPMAFGSVALIVGAFVGGNSFIEGAHARKPTPEP